MIRMASERGIPSAAHRDDYRTDALDDGQDVHDFRRLSAVGNGQHDILLRHHAEVAMKRLGRMHEERRRPRTREARRNLPPDMPRLPHARDDDTATTGKNTLHSSLECIIDAVEQTGRLLKFDADGLLGGFLNHDFLLIYRTLSQSHPLIHTVSRLAPGKSMTFMDCTIIAEADAMRAKFSNFFYRFRFVDIDVAIIFHWKILMKIVVNSNFAHRKHPVCLDKSA